MILGWQQTPDGTWHALVSAWHPRQAISPRTPTDGPVRSRGPPQDREHHIPDALDGPAVAPRLTAELLDPATARYRHSAGVAAAASRLAPAVDPWDAGVLVAAGWLHDIGYSAAIADTGFHPLDGARHLRRLGAPEQLCRLVAHHTCARRRSPAARPGPGPARRVPAA